MPDHAVSCRGLLRAAGLASQDVRYALLDRSLAAMVLAARDTNDPDSDTTEYLCKGTPGTRPVALNGPSGGRVRRHPVTATPR